jgi:hypothetical protein
MYGLGEMAAEIGGLSVSVSAAFMALAGLFAQFRMTAIMSNRLYEIDSGRQMMNESL